MSRLIRSLVASGKPSARSLTREKIVFSSLGLSGMRGATIPLCSEANKGLTPVPIAERPCDQSMTLGSEAAWA